MTKPTFTIIAPIYNELDNIPELYARIREVMDQTSQPWELILVDDGSTDGTAEMVASFPVRYVRMVKNAGPAAARDRDSLR